MEESDQLPEGFYYCSDCGKKTKHEYLKAILAIVYETCSDEELRQLEAETPEILTCTICNDGIPQEEEG